jgi:hypothetical protein
MPKLASQAGEEVLRKRFDVARTVSRFPPIGGQIIEVAELNERSTNGEMQKNKAGPQSGRVLVEAVTCSEGL